MRKVLSFLIILTLLSPPARAEGQYMILERQTAAADKSKSKPIFDVTEMLKPGNAGFFTLAPNYPFVGPVFAEETASEYITEIFGMLVQAADSMAREFYDSNLEENYTYWAFLVEALAVPHHESKLMHASRVNRDVVKDNFCRPELNELKEISSPTMLPVLNKFYRQQDNPIFPNCSVIKGEDTAEQVLISDFNKRDLGLMQLNAPTFIETMMPDIYLNLYNTIRFGTYHLYSKYVDIRMNRAKYPCLVETNPFGQKGSKPSAFYNLLRGTWGGGYNIGNTLVSSVCRFANSQSEDAAYDESFKKHLDSIVINNNSIFHRYLPAGSKERKALDEIVYNFRSAFNVGKRFERSANVNEVIDTDYFTHYLRGYDSSRIEPNYFLTANTLFYSVPNKGPTSICGRLRGALDKKTGVQVEKAWSFANPAGSQKTENWAAVRLSKYANNVEFTSSHADCIGGHRDMFFVDGNYVTEIASKDLKNTDLIGTVKHGRKARTYEVRQFYSLDSSIVANLQSGETVNIIESVNDKVKVRDRETGNLKDSKFKWYKILVPGKQNTFGYVHESAFETTRERQ